MVLYVEKDVRDKNKYPDGEWVNGFGLYRTFGERKRSGCKLFSALEDLQL